MNALTKSEGGALSTLSDNELTATLRSSLYPGASDQSIRMVLSYCVAAKLDPMDKPVHIVPMQVPTGKKDSNGWDITESRDVIMPGIGLYRIKAARTGEYGGQDEPEFGPDITDILDGVTVTYPAWCKVTVYRIRGGVRCPYTAKEFWRENYATKSRKSDAPNAMWRKRPYGQIAKCAEAQALRKGFPDAVGAAPTAEEMEGKSFEVEDIPTAPAAIRTPQPKAKQEAMHEATKNEAQDVEARPAAPASGCINAGQVKYLQQKIAALELDDEAVAQMIARHGAAALDTSMTVEQFGTIKSELLGMS